MLDFSGVFQGEKTIDDVLEGVGISELRDLTNEMTDTILGYMENCSDADVVFQPVDPKANDPYADDQGDENLAWNLGHLVVHVTASSEEAAALAAEMARGVEFHGRSRSEVPWQTVKTIEQCRHRLEESRRMCLASLDMWPDNPDLDSKIKPFESAPEMNAIGRFSMGLAHAGSHLAQIQEVVRQAKAN
ncbi:MAG: DinB family protein [Chloroflexota bacterium]